MAHFYASIQGNRGGATRMGTKSSGVDGHIRGWNIGARVYCGVDADGNDIVTVVLTGGSNGAGSKKLGTFKKHKQKDGNETFKKVS